MTSKYLFLPALNSSLRPKMRGEVSASSSETEALALPISDVSFEGLVVVAALVALLWLLFLKRKPSKDSAVEATNNELPLNGSTHRSTLAVGKSSIDDKTRTPTRISSAGSPWKAPEPFEAKSAEPSVGHRVVKGSAYVTDGDTIVINKVQIRLFGIDAPELDHPFGQKAKWAMVKLCKGHKIRAEITERDAYGRTVARCYLPDGRDLSAELVKQGLAIDWPKFSGGVYRKLEVPDARKKMWLADARQTGKLYLWEQFDYEQKHKRKAANARNARKEQP